LRPACIREQTKVFVFSQKCSRIAAGQCEDYLVGNAGIDLSDCRDVVAGFAEGDDDCEVATLVGEEPHRLSCSSIVWPF
jgi:hypothetical protein